jgi:hypothetical protein
VVYNRVLRIVFVTSILLGVLPGDEALPSVDSVVPESELFGWQSFSPETSVLGGDLVAATMQVDTSPAEVPADEEDMSTSDPDSRLLNKDLLPLTKKAVQTDIDVKNILSYPPIPASATTHKQVAAFQEAEADIGSTLGTLGTSAPAARKHDPLKKFFTKAQVVKEQQAQNKIWAHVNQAKTNAARFKADQAKQRKMNSAAAKARRAFKHTREKNQKKYGVHDDPEDRAIGSASAIAYRKWLIDGPRGSAAGKHTSDVVSSDSYTSPKGQYFLGRRRRRIGAGFGRRRFRPWKGKVPNKLMKQTAKGKSILKVLVKGPSSRRIKENHYKEVMQKAKAGRHPSVDPHAHFSPKVDDDILGGKLGKELGGATKKKNIIPKVAAKKGKPTGRECAHVCTPGMCDSPADAKKKECAACVKCHDTHSLKAGEEAHDHHEAGSAEHHDDHHDHDGAAKKAAAKKVTAKKEAAPKPKLKPAGKIPAKVMSEMVGGTTVTNEMVGGR